jgi:hypothetical protein
MVTRGGGNFSVMAASPRAFRVGPSESAETGGPCRAQERPGAAQEHGAGFNAREVPKLPSVRRQLFRYPGYPGPSAHTRAGPKGQLNPAGFSFPFAGRCRLTLLFKPILLVRGGFCRPGKSGGPPLFEPSFKVQRDSTHNQSSGFAVAPGSRPQRARSFKGPS